jgi:hypothetical protein
MHGGIVVMYSTPSHAQTRVKSEKRHETEMREAQ